MFLLMGLLPAILLSEHRKIFRNKHLYFSIAVAFIIVFPNIIWQYQNNFPTYHQLQELSKTQLVNVNRSDFIKEQILFFINSFFIIIASFISFFFYPPFKKYRLFFWSFCISLVVFIFFKAKSYYAIGLYSVLLAFGSVYLEKILAIGWKRYLRPVSMAVVIGLFIPFLLVAFPIQSPEQIQQSSQRYKAFGLLRWEDGKDHALPQDFADMVGWSELAKKADSVYAVLTDKEHSLVLCDNYGQAGAINYYSTFKNLEAVSLNADYINWIPLAQEIKNVILIQSPDDDDTARAREKPWFERIVLAGEIKNPYAREQGTKIYLLQGAKVNINEILAREIKKRKNYYP
jgi:hypothetical protein